jgi:hypothetical protein
MEEKEGVSLWRQVEALDFGALNAPERGNG